MVVFDLTEAGGAANMRTAYQWPEKVLQDGIMFDEHGRLWVATWDKGTLDVISEDGEMLGSVDVGGSNVTNLCWWEESVYVTVAGRHSIHRLDVGCRGAEIVPRTNPEG